MRDGVATKFFGKAMSKRSLMSVAEMAIGSAGGAGAVFDYVASLFSSFVTSDAQRLLPEFS